MDPAIFKERFYQGKLVVGIVQCPANGSFGQYNLMLGFHPLPESIIIWFYNLPAAQQFLLCTKSVFLQTQPARRSFCSNEYLRGTDPMVIMAISGHKSHKSFMRYIKVSGEQFADKLE
jgi:hypothetical protein